MSTGTVTAPGPPLLGLPRLDTAASLAQQAYAAIKQALMDTDIYGADNDIRLDERQLGDALGVSRTPIREAMTRLEQEGFLRTVPRIGVFVVRKTRREIVEMVEIWAALESMAARKATQRATDAEIASLRHMFDEFSNSSPADHIDEYSDANIAFHQAVIRLADSPLMDQIIEALFFHVRAIRRRTISQSDRAQRSIAEHMRIIEALERRDTEAAERLTREHSLGLAAHIEQYCDFLD